jgi:hypothetical protein
MIQPPLGFLRLAKSWGLTRNLIEDEDENEDEDDSNGF